MSATPPPYQPPPGYPGVPPQVWPEQSQAVLALVMSIVGLVVCSGLLCPVGWYYANQELQGIDAGRRDPTKRDMATAGKIIGMIGTGLLILGLLFFVGFIIFAIVAAGTS